MPNHTSNKLEIHGSREVIDEIYNAHCCPEFSFDTWLPMPKALNKYSRGESNALRDLENMLHLQLPASGFIMSQSTREAMPMSREELCGATNMLRYGYAGWFGWACDNWGTKWDAYQTEVTHEECYLRVDFQTAWSPPEAAIRELAELYPEAEIEMRSLGEGAEYGWICRSENGLLHEHTIEQSELPDFAREHFEYDPDEFEEE